MQISPINNNFGQKRNRSLRNEEKQIPINSHLSFGTSFVTLSKSNLGENIRSSLIPNFVKKWWNSAFDTVSKVVKENAMPIAKEAEKGIKLFVGNSTGRIASEADFSDKVDFYMLAAGSGSRFQNLAGAVKGWQDGAARKANANKITLGFPVEQNIDLPMIDFGLNGIGKYFAKSHEATKIAGDTAQRVEGTVYETILANGPTGSFGDIMLRNLSLYREAEKASVGSGDNIFKDTVVCCGDNVFGESAESLLGYFTKAINDENVHLALVGAKRPPEVAAERFGVIKVADAVEGDSKILKVTGFEEKPKLEVINAPGSGLVTGEGNCVANTGMFYVSKEAMTGIVKKMNALIPNDYKGDLKDVDAFKNKSLNPFNKNNTEIFDFANVSKWVQAELAKENGGELNIKDGVSIVKQVGTWEDVGEPKAYLDFLKESKEGHFIENFSSDQQVKIKKSIEDRVLFPSKEGDIGEISYSNKYKTLEEAKKAYDVEMKEVKDGKDTVLKVYVDKPFDEIVSQVMEDISNNSKNVTDNSLNAMNQAKNDMNVASSVLKNVTESISNSTKSLESTIKDLNMPKMPEVKVIKTEPQKLNVGFKDLPSGQKVGLAAGLPAAGLAVGSIATAGIYEGIKASNEKSEN